MKFIPMQDCIQGCVYKLNSRNLRYGVYDGTGGFIGIRTKFDARFLFKEYHYDKSKHLGTVVQMEDILVILPDNISLNVNLGTTDRLTGKAVRFDTSINNGGRGWYFTSTGEPSLAIRAQTIRNCCLFTFLDNLEKKFK